MTLPPIDKRWISNPPRVLKTYRLNEREVIALDHTKYGSILQWVACEAMKQRVCEPKNIVNHLYNKVGIDLRYDIINKGEHLGATNGPWQAIVVCPTLGMKFSVFSETPNGLNEEEESDVSFSEEGGEEEEMEEEEGMEEEDVIDEDTEQEEEEGEEVNSLQLHPFPRKQDAEKAGCGAFLIILMKMAKINGLSKQEHFPPSWTDPTHQQNVELVAHEEIDNEDDLLLMQKINETISNLSALIRSDGGYFTEYTFMTSKSRFTTLLIENSTGHVFFPATQKNSKSCYIVEGPHPSLFERRRIMLLSENEIPSNFEPDELPTDCVLRNVESFSDLISSQIVMYITAFFHFMKTNPRLFEFGIMSVTAAEITSRELELASEEWQQNVVNGDVVQVFGKDCPIQGLTYEMVDPIHPQFLQDNFLHRVDEVKVNFDVKCDEAAAIVMVETEDADGRLDGED